MTSLYLSQMVTQTLIPASLPFIENSILLSLSLSLPSRSPRCLVKLLYPSSCQTLYSNIRALFLRGLPQVLSPGLIPEGSMVVFLGAGQFGIIQGGGGGE